MGLGTGGVLAYGMYTFTQGGGGMAANKAMRLRIFAQGLTVGGMLGYFVLFQTPVKNLWQKAPEQTEN